LNLFESFIYEEMLVFPFGAFAESGPSAAAARNGKTARITVESNIVNRRLLIIDPRFPPCTTATVFA
jgi:hypothetical protein